MKTTFMCQRGWFMIDIQYNQDAHIKYHVDF